MDEERWLRLVGRLEARAHHVLVSRKRSDDLRRLEEKVPEPVYRRG
jgi:hypothetical protein